VTAQFKQKSEEFDKIRAATFDAPEGEVRWVNQRNGAVWINLGKADGLPTQMTFAVYPADITNMNTSARKASLEVTQILGDHLAEARITADKADDPVMPGDKINTPLWNPGEIRHFALTGFLDIDGDGKNDLSTVRDLITMNGGVVDCYLDETGHVVGKMTLNTRYFVAGERPDDKDTDRAIREGYSKMEVEQEQLGTRKISLQELLNQMGWKKPASVVHYGRSASAEDFQAKPEPGKQKTAPGNVFTPRQPPKKSPDSAF